MVRFNRSMNDVFMAGFRPQPGALWPDQRQLKLPPDDN